MIPVIVTARDEALAIGACLDSLGDAIEYAERAGNERFELVVVLDDCRDATPAIARRRGVRTLVSSGGKVEAQRVGSTLAGPYHVFSDADILVERTTLAAIAEAMRDSRVRVAFPRKLPLVPRRRTLLARALHVYNARRGFSTQRTWFSGKLFAIRGWSAPDAEEITRRAHRLPDSRFYDLAAPLRVDDIYLSRAIRHTDGVAALRETAGTVWFRAPETWLGMYRYYRRMRRELERIDYIFPELSQHALDERRSDTLAGASSDERRAWRVFQLALAGCRVAYHAERIACELGLRTHDPWPAIAETKQL